MACIKERITVVAAAINADELMFAAYGNENFSEMYSSYMFKDQVDWYTEAGSDRYNENNPERAKELFAEAGYDGTLSLEVDVPVGPEAARSLAFLRELSSNISKGQ